MSVITNIPVIETALWPQGDIRDPLGVWAARNANIIGDVSAGVITGNITVPAARRRARIYTCYFATAVRVGDPTDAATQVKCRLLTNWPNADLIAGIQGFGSFSSADVSTTTGSFPVQGPKEALVRPSDRLILLFDPAGGMQDTDMDIVQIERNANTNLTAYSIEAWGYYWDRSVLNAPGGPRHPGAS